MKPTFDPNDLRITMQHIRALTINERNPRKHPRSQIAKIESSIRAYGFVNPIIVDEANMVLCGEGRLQAATRLGMSHVPTINLSHMSEADKRAYIIADNRLAEDAQWSKTVLRAELKGLVEIGYKVELTGFSTLEIDTALSIGEPEPKIDDDVYLTDDPPVARVGDLWTVSVHRLVVGDARDRDVIEQLMDGDKAAMIFTDPPFGNRISNNVSGLGRVKHGNFAMGSGETSLAEFGDILLRPAFKQLARFSKPGAIGFVCCDWRSAPHFLEAAAGVFHEVKNLIIWSKTNAGMGVFYRSAHELIYAFKINAGEHINNFELGQGGRHRSNVWTYAGANVFRAGRLQDLNDHPTVKPKNLVRDAILDCSRRGDIILDTFAGSGTTAVAAQMCGRRGYLVELDPKYADVILRRLSEECKLPAMLGDETFEQVAARRAAGGEEPCRG